MRSMVTPGVYVKNENNTVYSHRAKCIYTPIHQMLNSVPRILNSASLLFVAITAVLCQIASAQFVMPTPGAQFDLAEGVELDRAEGTAPAQLVRVKAFLADRKWDEAVDTLCQLTENSEGKLLGVTENRFVGLRDYCQMQLASLPPEALKLYRARVDPVTRKWYEDGLANHDTLLLRKVVEQGFASSWGDDALLTLGDMALESGDYTSARWYWERIIPHQPPAGQASTWSGYPDSRIDLAAVRARLVLASILEGSQAKAHDELEQFTRLHGDARGRLGGLEVKYAEALGALLSESASWPVAPQDFDWPTFAGSPARNAVYPQKSDVGGVAWRAPLPEVAMPASGLGATVGQANRATHTPLSYHPVVVGDLLLVNTAQEILALRLSTGKPAWGRNSGVIFRDLLAGAAAGLSSSAADINLPSGTLGMPRFTLTVFGDKLYAYMGSGLTSMPQGQPADIRPGFLVCLDLAAEGRLLWKIAPEDGWTFDGTPLADSRGVYVAMRRIDIRPRAYAACFDAQTGRLRWRQFVASAETPARGMLYQTTHDLLTMAGDSIYFNTNLGAVAAINIDDGRLRWVSLYPRRLHGDLASPAAHWQRDLNPCLYHQGTLYVAPADSPRIFAIDALSGMILWQSGDQTEDALDLLGATDDYLIAGGNKLYWIGLKDEDRGRVKHVWPEGNDKPGFGRGIIAGGCVLWPTREQILAFDLKTAQPRKAIDLLPRGARGGNLLATELGLLIATDNELIALGKTANPSREKQQEIAKIP
jgi:outer membrane protein assembly factor BamB